MQQMGVSLVQNVEIILPLIYEEKLSLLCVLQMTASVKGLSCTFYMLLLRRDRN